MKRKKAKADPVLTEIVRNGVLAVTEEMKSNLMRTAYNMIIYEALDFTVGLFTADGRTTITDQVFPNAGADAIGTGDPVGEGMGGLFTDRC